MARRKRHHHPESSAAPGDSALADGKILKIPHEKAEFCDIKCKLCLPGNLCPDCMFRGTIAEELSYEYADILGQNNVKIFKPSSLNLPDRGRKTRSRDQHCNDGIASTSVDCSGWLEASSKKSYTRSRSIRSKRSGMDTLWRPFDLRVSYPLTRSRSRKCNIRSVSMSADCSPHSKPSKRRKDSQCGSIIDLSSVNRSVSLKIGTRETSAQSRSSRQNKLDTNTFQNCFEQIWTNLSEEKRESFCFLDCLWFSLYFEKSKSSREKVLRWINCKRVFLKKYIVIPIVRWRHWNLLILCHFGEISQSQTRTPCMLLLDSLHLANPKRLEVEIRRFVLDIYRAEGTSDPEKMAMITRAPLLLPKVPQQRNQECGHFVLYYTSLFAENAPDDFSTLGYPYFMKEDWFCPDDLNSFCSEYGLSIN